jgi:hypothetical protein
VRDLNRNFNEVRQNFAEILGLPITAASIQRFAGCLIKALAAFLPRHSHTVPLELEKLY